MILNYNDIMGKTLNSSLAMAYAKRSDEENEMNISDDSYLLFTM